MARFALFSIVVISFVLSVVSAGLLPNLPLPIPLNKQAAANRINRGAGIGKGSINTRISIFVDLANLNPTYTPECKQCIADKANATRANSLGQIDAVKDSLIAEIENLSPLDNLAIVWGNLLGNLVTPGGLIGQVVSETNQSLEAGRCDCLQQTMNQTCSTA